MDNKFKNISYAIAILIGITFSGYWIGISLQKFRNEDRSIAVKGFAEKEVKSNLAVWTIKNKITSNNLEEASKNIEDKKLKILTFLKSNGIAAADIFQQRLNVIDKLAREYVGDDRTGFRYIIENTMQVRTSNVDVVDKVSKMTDEMLKMGIVIAEEQEYNRSVSYIYTGLNDIKPQMLSEAAQNARKAAAQFTQDSKVKLGDLKKGSQGLFTIVDRDAANMSANQNDYQSSTNDIYKKVRVVVNVEYSIN